MISTPDLSHLTSKDYEHVYEPAEDTFLLLDALESEAQNLRNDHPTICLEVGSGSGCVTCFIRKILGPSVHINPHACLCSLSTGIQNKVSLEPINANFALPFHFRLKHSIDIIIFNPPYVPTLTNEARGAQETRDIQGSWAGGSDGMGITNQFLDLVEELMAPRARFYLVAIKENDIPGIRRKMLEVHGLQSEVGNLIIHRLS